MTTGTLSSGICFASQAAAARNECSVMYRSTSQGMTCTGMVAPLPSETAGGAVAVSLTQRWQSAGTTTFTTTTISQPLQACELEDYWPMPLSAANGALIGSAVVTAWVVAACWKWYRQAM